MNAKNRGFTLIELLVVIAIIAMLLAIVMPAMNKAKMYAEEVMCKSNIHQYHVATDTYALENKEYYPNPWVSFYKACVLPTEINRYCRWHNPLFNLQTHPEYAGPYWPYLAITKANICPTFAKLAPKYGASHPLGCVGGPFEPQFSYSMNGRLNPPVPGRAYDQCQLDVTVRRGQIKSPYQTFLWAEENMWTMDVFNPAPTRVQLTGAVLNDNSLRCPNPPGDTGDFGSDGFGSFHKISAAQLNLQRNENLYKSGMSDVLFVDGHAEFVPPWDFKTKENVAAKYKGIIR